MPASHIVSISAALSWTPPTHLCNLIMPFLITVH